MLRKAVWISFIAFPLLLAAFILLSPDATFSGEENRSLKTKSAISFRLSDGTFQEDLETCLSDQFPFRSRLKSAEEALRLALGQKELNGVYVGAKMRFFAAIKPQDADLSALARDIQGYNTLSGKTGLPLICLLIPAAGCMLKEELPAHASMYHYEGLMEALCCTKVILDASEDYYRTDHHFTTEGAWRVYTLFQALKGEDALSYEDFQPYTASDSFLGSLYRKVLLQGKQADTIVLLRSVPESVTVTADGKEVPFYDLTSLEGNDPYRVFQGGNHGITVIKNPEAAEDRTLLLLGDSFANSFVQFLVQDYRIIVKMDRRYTFEDPAEISTIYEADEILVLKEAVHMD